MNNESFVTDQIKRFAETYSEHFLTDEKMRIARHEIGHAIVYAAGVLLGAGDLTRFRFKISLGEKVGNMAPQYMGTLSEAMAELDTAFLRASALGGCILDVTQSDLESFIETKDLRYLAANKPSDEDLMGSSSYLPKGLSILDAEVLRFAHNAAFNYSRRFPKTVFLWVLKCAQNHLTLTGQDMLAVLECADDQTNQNIH